VVFVGRHRKTAKVIWADENGGWLLYRRLQQKKFARFITSLESQTSMNFTVEEVLNFMDGGAAPVRKD
ncbi:IS66 family insertion sequence element accessory protein TnpB, partial [Sutterella wadsworthensis]